MKVRYLSMKALVIAFEAKLMKIDRRSPVLSGHKDGDNIILMRGPEQIVMIFDNNISFTLDPTIAEAVGWEVGDIIEFTGRRQPREREPEPEGTKK